MVVVVCGHHPASSLHQNNTVSLYLLTQTYDSPPHHLLVQPQLLYRVAGSRLHTPVDLSAAQASCITALVGHPVT